EQTQAVAWTTAIAAPNAMSVGSGARSDRTSVATLAPPTPAVPASSSVGKLTIKNPTGQGTYLKQSMAQSNMLPDSEKRWANNNSELPLLHWSTVNDHYAIVLNGSLDGLQKWFVYKNHVTIEPLGQPLQQNTPGNPPVQSLPMLQRSPSNSVVEVAKPPASVTNSLYGGASGKVPLPAIAIVKQFEGCYLKAYPDPLTGGKPITIGWGCTRKKDGSEWSLGERITQEEADDLLIYQLDRDYLPPLEKIPVWNELNVNQKAALLSFAYNLGARFYGSNNFQSMTRVLANKQWDEIESTFLKYRNPGSNVEAGLKRRRLAEAKLFLTPPASTEVSNPPSAPLQKFATATPAFVPSQSFATAAPSASSIPTNGSDNYLWVQQQLIRLCILDPPADGKWGKQSKAALASFQQLKGLANTGEIDSATLAALGSTQELIPLKLGTDFASSLTQYMMKKGYFVPRGDRRYSIVYVHSLNEQFQPTPSTPDAWDDRRMILEIPNNGVPRIVNHWTATCDPGLAPTQRSRIAGGVAQVAFGQYQAWQHGFHGYGKRYPPYPSLVQAGPVDIMRDTNRNYRRDSGDTLIQKSTGNGINQHHGWNASEVGFNSEGCLVGKNVEGHHEFIDLCKQDVRYQVNPGYTYFTTVIEGADIFKT
ncbi:MAG TPA: peptidoglycan-binding protein, partial [Chroococcales cyanobacterium]